jgi:hypothetical protein
MPNIIDIHNRLFEYLIGWNSENRFSKAEINPSLISEVLTIPCFKMVIGFPVTKNPFVYRFGRVGIHEIKRQISILRLLPAELPGV